jgi:hypothetical protein
MPLIDDYLEFLEARCRPNTVLAAAYDVKVFFTVVAKPRIGQGHLGASSSVDGQPQWLVEMSRKITGITSMSSAFGFPRLERAREMGHAQLEPGHRGARPGSNAV